MSTSKLWRTLYRILGEGGGRKGFLEVEYSILAGRSGNTTTVSQLHSSLVMVYHS